MSIFQTAIITSIKEETAGVKTFTISYADGSAIPYLAGQFITFAFTHHGREERRSYSISSSPDVDAPLSFTVKRVDNGAYSRLLIDRAAVGERLLTTGAAGLFTLPVDMSVYRQVFFFAAGIGITPVFSLIKSVLHTQADKQVVLIYSNSSKNDVVFYDELQGLITAFPARFKVEFLYSTNFNLKRARLSKELLPVLLKEYASAPIAQILFYICGPFSYMRMATLSLEENSIDSNNIRKENFNTNDRQIKAVEPPDKAAHTVTLNHDGNTYSCEVQYPDSILQAAKKQGISLPYSCEVGRCGSCAARCTSGKVWLSYNEVLMDMDLKHGAILTCTGHPVDGDVVIEA
jgi:ring-1,2-phenylacetyl-CoA epoxidase subunit PaaE